MKRKLLAIILTLVLVLSLAACGGKEKTPDTPDNTETEGENATQSDVPPSDDTPSKPEDNSGDPDVTAEEKPSDNGEEGQPVSQMMCGVTSAVGASRLYNEYDGEYVLHGITSLNSMYIVENCGSLSSVRDLEGKTVYVSSLNDMGTFALKYILSENGIADTVTIIEKTEDWIEDQMERGEEMICVAGLEMTIDLIEECANAKAQIDIAGAWKELTGYRLYEGCVVSLRDSRWEKEAADIIEDWNEGVLEVKADADRLGLSYDERIVSGEYDMMDELTDFFMKVYKIDPEIVGGSIPDDAFYSES